MPEPTTVRRLWKIYQERLAGLPLSIHEKALMREAFYMGAISMCRMLKHLATRGETERMAKIISRTALYRETAKKARRRFRH